MRRTHIDCIYIGLFGMGMTCKGLQEMAVYVGMLWSFQAREQKEEEEGGGDDEEKKGEQVKTRKKKKKRRRRGKRRRPRRKPRRIIDNKGEEEKKENKRRRKKHMGEEEEEQNLRNWHIYISSLYGGNAFGAFKRHRSLPISLFVEPGHWCPKCSASPRDATGVLEACRCLGDFLFFFHCVWLFLVVVLGLCFWFSVCFSKGPY